MPDQAKAERPNAGTMPTGDDAMAVDQVVDCIDLRCPLPVLRARKALERMQPGQVARIDTTDPMALVDVPHMVRAEGHVLVEQAVEAESARFWVRRGSV